MTFIRHCKSRFKRLPFAETPAKFDKPGVAVFPDQKIDQKRRFGVGKICKIVGVRTLESIIRQQINRNEVVLMNGFPDVLMELFSTALFLRKRDTF